MSAADLDEVIAAIRERTGSVADKTDTPIPAGVLRDLVAASDCRSMVSSLRDEMRGELDDIKAEQRAQKKLIEELPAQFATLVFEDRDRERQSKAEQNQARMEFCRGVLDGFLGSKIFMTLAGTSLLVAAIGLFLSATSFDLSFGEWFNVSADRALEENRTRREELPPPSNGDGPSVAP